MEQQPTDGQAPKENVCRDCAYHSNQIEEARKTTGVRGNWTPTDHKMGAMHCLTLLSLNKRVLPLQPVHSGAGTKTQE